MPPKLSKKALQITGFVAIRVYLYPAIAHRVSYKQFSGLRSIFNNSLVRGLALLYLSTLKKSDHGVVVARKPLSLDRLDQKILVLGFSSSLVGILLRKACQ
jgi:hypothetical protein